MVDWDWASYRRDYPPSHYNIGDWVLAITYWPQERWMAGKVVGKHFRPGVDKRRAWSYILWIDDYREYERDNQITRFEHDMRPAPTCSECGDRPVTDDRDYLCRGCRIALG